MKKLSFILAAMLVFAANAFAATFSGSLPVMYINTENSTPITSKDYYLNATYYVDNLGLDGYQSVGSASEPLALKIKGRGNYTFTGFDKKPYRLKLDAKAALLGMKKSKHFALLAHADDDLGFLRNTMGFELSRRMGLDFTPEQRPVEVVLNGDYIGLYFLTETIRVDSDRVKITEQADNETDPDNITGGWLVEIDNYDEDAQVSITEGNGEKIRLTYKSPEALSTAQSDYLVNLANAVNTAIYANDKSSTDWENYIDIDSLAAFYVVQEVMDNAESFHGSCYFHKDRGADTKIIFGPVWDFGNSFHRGTDRFIYQDPPFGQTWIGEIAKFPRFQSKVKEVWKKFITYNYSSLDQFASDFASQISSAAKADYNRWPNYGNQNMTDRKNSFLNMLHAKVNWLVNQWGGAGISATNASASISVSVLADGSLSFSEPIVAMSAYDLTGRQAVVSLTSATTATLSGHAGVYILQIQTATTTATAKVAIR